MKNIRFKEILFLSYREKRARRINLDSDVIVVKGGNGSGKSCLLKSIYGVFGAQINKYPEGWNPNSVIVLLKFQIDGVPFRAMRIGKDFYLIKPDDVYFSETSDLEVQADALSTLFDLELYYYADQTKRKRLPLGCYFMPFYIDQDAGWQQPWSSFTQIGNDQMKRNVMLYYTGVINYDYYNSQSRLLSLRSEYNRWNAQKNVQNSFLTIVKDKLQTHTISLSEDDFKTEMDAFVRSLQELKEKQNKILKELEELYFNKMFKESRILSLHASISEIEEDFKYALQKEELIMCPVCGAQTNNTALARLAMNIDKEECRELIVQYRIELQEIEKRINNTKCKSDDLKKQIEEIQKLVTTKKEEYTLKEYLNHKVIEKLYELFAEKEQEYEDNLLCLANEIREENVRLRASKGTNRLKMLSEYFNERLLAYAKDLGCRLNSSKKHMFGEKIKGSGSSHPKETLVYFFAYLHIMQKHGSPLMLPIVIDEFKQNGTTNKSISKMIDFAINHRPTNGQVIYAVSDDYVNDKEGVRVIRLNENRLLIQEDYESVYDEVDRILNKNFKMI